MNTFSSFVAPLDDLAVIEIAGPDAASFLHGQLTHDVTGLPSDQARLAGYCTAKGRLLGSMVVWRGHQAPDSTLYAIVKADVAATLVKRLSMFVLRAKATLTLSGLTVVGVALERPFADKPAGPGPSPAQGLINEAGILSAQSQAWDVARTDAGSWIAAPSADSAIARWWFIAQDAHSHAYQPASSTNAAECWRAADIAAGLPWVEAATQDVFIPQTLNLDLIDGVSFTKGCYPGQEVVARSHYRGTVKRRMAYGIVDAAAGVAAGTLAGVDIYNTHNPASPCGRIVNAAVCDGIHVLMEVQLSDLADADFRLQQADGAPIDLLPLPYRIKAED